MRADGRKIKGIASFYRIMPYIMKERTDSMNFYEDGIACAPMDEYIKAKRLEGYSLNYMHLIIAAMVRMIATRPRLNRFIMNGKFYARPKIWVSLAVHRVLDENDIETTIKFCFDGTESIFEIAAQIDKKIYDETHAQGGEENDTDKTARIITKVPSCLISFIVGVLKWMDKHNIMPKAIIEASPFHTTFFITNLKSLGINHIFHHCYNFGTTSMFIAIGKEKPFLDLDKDGNVIQEKRLDFGFVMDERICDGLYYAKSLRALRKIMRDPSCLEQKLSEKTEDIA